MINCFADRETEKIWKGEKSKVLPKNPAGGRRKLRMINNVESINNLRIPGNHFKKLKEALSDFYSI